MRDAGIRGLVVVHHTPHGRATPRGSTRFTGWPSAAWTYTKPESEAADSTRRLKVVGRDVRLRPTEVVFDAATRRLSVAAKPAKPSGQEIGRQLAVILARVGELTTEELAAQYLAAHGAQEGGLTERIAKRRIFDAARAGRIADCGKRGRSRVFGPPKRP